MKQPAALATTPQITLPTTKDLSWVGCSRAGISTSFCIPELRWMFDCGTGTTGSNQHHSSFIPACIFLTHTHADHVQALAQVLFRLNNNIKGHQHSPRTLVYLPAAALTKVQDFLRAFVDMVRDDDDDDGPCNDAEQNHRENSRHYKLCPVDFDQEFIVPQPKKGGNKNFQYSVRVIQCDHRKVCVGYSIFRQSWALKEIYRNVPGLELRRLAQSGIQLKEWSQPLQPVLAFLGDTTARVFELRPELLRSEQTVVAVECTFFQESDVTRAAQMRHMHWNDLQQVMRTHPKVLFLLQHFSVKHSDRQWWTWIRAYNSTSNNHNAHAMLPPASASPSGSNDAKEEEEALSCNCFVCCRPTLGSPDG